MYNIEELKIRLLSELKEIAEEMGVKNFKTLKKDDLVYAILDQQAITPDKALPKKKPAKVELDNTEKANSQEGTGKSEAARETEKPKFKRQNVTEISQEQEEKAVATSKEEPKSQSSKGQGQTKKTA